MTMKMTERTQFLAGLVVMVVAVATMAADEARSWGAGWRPDEDAKSAVTIEPLGDDGVLVKARSAGSVRSELLATGRGAAVKFQYQANQPAKLNFQGLGKAFDGREMVDTDLPATDGCAGSKAPATARSRACS